MTADNVVRLFLTAEKIASGSADKASRLDFPARFGHGGRIHKKKRLPSERNRLIFLCKNGRGEKIRTSDP